MPRPLVLSRHAQLALTERSIDRAWVEETLAAPDWTAPDPAGADIWRAYGAITTRGGRVLRVVYRDEGAEVRVITAFFDRGARRP